MNKVLIFGAGSLGNHMAYASRRLNFDVYMTDINPLALKRMKTQIFPKRYKIWDNKIKLVNYKNVFSKKSEFDLIVIGTPPKTHINILKNCNNYLRFKKILIEKPLCVYNEKNLNFVRKLAKKKMLFCGYNHSLSNAYNYFSKIVLKKFKKVEFIEVKWNEGWQGILKAHFWMKDEFQTYLGNIYEGGGALHEHSHGLNLFQLVMEKFKLQIKSFSEKKIINFKKKGKKKYDNYFQLLLSKKDQILKYTTNLLTFPAEKKILIRNRNVRAELVFNYKDNIDNVSFFKNEKLKLMKNFKKTRSSEFENELKHVINIKNAESYRRSNINVLNGIKTIMIIKKLLKND